MDMRELYEKDLEEAKKDVKNSISEDFPIIQLINHIEDLDKIINQLVKRLRDWYELYLPEVSRMIESDARFVKTIKKSKEELVKEFNIENCMGRDFGEGEKEPLESLRSECERVLDLRDKQKERLKGLMEKLFPNVYTLAGGIVGGKLLSIAGGIKNLSGMPASTIQILGAEKAFFRHMKSGARPPKYGILYNHELVERSEHKAKTAHSLADKISIAAKVDYFNGEFVGEDLKKKIK